MLSPLSSRPRRARPAASRPARPRGSRVQARVVATIAGETDGRPSTVSGRSRAVIRDAMNAVLTSNGFRRRWSLKRPRAAPVCTSPLSIPTSLVVQMWSARPRSPAPGGGAPPPQELAVGGALRPHGGGDLGFPVVPAAEARHVEVADVDDVHEEAAAGGGVAAPRSRPSATSPAA